MATYHTSITDEQAQLIRNTPVFFVATADPALASGPHGIGSVNLSPKGGVPLFILGPNRVAFLDYAGSGNETARHSLAGGPITVMICSFEAENAAIVRLFGHAKVTAVADSPLASQLLEKGAPDLKLPPRNIVEIEIEHTMTSCGYGVPVMNYVRERQGGDRGSRYKS